jgi:hypothetical protein
MELKLAASGPFDDQRGVISIVRRIKFRAESISRVTSSGLSTVGSFLGRLGNGISSSR